MFIIYIYESILSKKALSSGNIDPLAAINIWSGLMRFQVNMYQMFSLIMIIALK